MAQQREIHLGSKASREFEGLLKSVDQIIAIHRKLQTGAGRRYEQEALHHAGVVMTVAAWQAYIEKVSHETLDWIEALVLFDDGGSKAPTWARSTFYMRKPAVAQAIGALNTPNSDNVRKLLKTSFGYDPFSDWTWNAGLRSWTSAQFCERTNQWLRVRHTIAHGVQLPNNISWINGTNGAARLNLTLLLDCRRHFEKLVELTDAGLARHLRTEHGKKAWRRPR